MTLFCSQSVSFKPKQDIPALDGKVILVTGGNIGLGKQCILEYARHNPAEIWLAARNLDKAKAAVEETQNQLASEAHTGSGRRTRSGGQRPPSLFNAGIMAVPPGHTHDGYEVQFGTNYVGHALLVKLLTPVLERTASLPRADVRVVSLSSHGHTLAPQPEGIRFDLVRPVNSAAERAIGAYRRYGQSKLAQILWTRRMAARHPVLTFVSVHPGVVQTNLLNNATGSAWPIRLLGGIAYLFVTPVEQGVRNQLWASVAKDGVRSGEYYEPVGIVSKAFPLARDEDLEEKLWQWTEKELEAYAL